MNTEVLSGPVVMVLGIGTVFTALVLLVGIVTLLARAVAGEPLIQNEVDWVKNRLDRDKAGGGTAQPHPVPGAPVAAMASQDAEETAVEAEELKLVAIAAYGLHQRRRVNVPPPPTPSPWLRAGRQGLVTRIGTKS